MEHRHDRHTKSMLAEHMVFTPKYRGKVLVGDIAGECDKVIREICKELDVEVLDLAVAPDHVHLLIQYPPKLSVSEIAKKVKGGSSKRLRSKFPELKEWCEKGLWTRSAYHGSVGVETNKVSRYIEFQK